MTDIFLVPAAILLPSCPPPPPPNTHTPTPVMNLWCCDHSAQTDREKKRKEKKYLFFLFFFLSVRLSVCPSVCLFIDFAKAFDVINHDLLLRKLTLYGLSANTLSLICSFLNSRLQKVSLKDNQSDFETVLFGVPQGSVLGPLLFSIYINDLPLHIPSAQCDMLADDTTIHTSGQDVPAIISVLQSCLSDVVEWTHLNHMSLNPSKTKYMILTTRQKRQLLHSPSAHLFVVNQQITKVSDHKVLGVTIDNIYISFSMCCSNLCCAGRPYILCVCALCACSFQ